MQEQEEKQAGFPLGIIVLAPLAIYFLGFSVILIDAFVLGHIINRMLPGAVVAVLKGIYWPLLRIVRFFL